MKRTVLSFALIALALTPAALAQTTGTTTLSVAVAAEGSITVTTGTTALTESGGAFSNFTAPTNMTYLIRTTPASGSGSVTLKVTTDFSPASGPSVASPPTAGDKLAYTCTASGISSPTACSGSQTASTSSSTPVLTVGADAHSAASGDSTSVTWTLTNDPKYKVGSYQATVTFTISAT